MVIIAFFLLVFLYYYFGFDALSACVFCIGYAWCDCVFLAWFVADRLCLGFCLELGGFVWVGWVVWLYKLSMVFGFCFGVFTLFRVLCYCVFTCSCLCRLVCYYFGVK